MYRATASRCTHARRNEDTFEEMKIQLTSRIGGSGEAPMGKSLDSSPNSSDNWTIMGGEGEREGSARIKTMVVLER